MLPGTKEFRGYQKEWYVKNKERIKLQRLQYLKDNPEAKKRRLEKAKVWYDTHLEQVKVTRRAYRKKHPELWRIRRLRYRKISHKFVDDYKVSLGGKCCICGYSKCMQALDFHHKDSTIKGADVHDLVRRSSLKAIKEELLKCILVCSNCHRELHIV